jgi:hypothetical protein
MMMIMGLTVKAIARTGHFIELSLLFFPFQCSRISSSLLIPAVFTADSEAVTAWLYFA